jgi:hypothetical protein
VKLVEGCDRMMALESHPVDALILVEIRDGAVVGAQRIRTLTGRIEGTWQAEGWRWRWSGDRPYALTRDLSRPWAVIIDAELTDDDRLDPRDPWEARGFAPEWMR